MTRTDILAEPLGLPDLYLLIARHGRWRVLRATLAAALRRSPPASGDARALNDHLRRDIGLPPIAAPPLRWY